MERNYIKMRGAFEELGVALFNCLCAMRTLADGLSGLGGLVGGLVEVAEHSEIRPESLAVIMEKLYEYSEEAREAEETLLKLKRSTS